MGKSPAVTTFFMVKKPYIIEYQHREALMREALSLAYRTSVDELDCAKSFARQNTMKFWDEILAIGLTDERAMFTFIRRDADVGEREMYEIGLSTTSMGVKYFIWMDLTIPNGDFLIKKYSLRQRDF